MKGFVPTPAAVVDDMVGRLFDGAPPSPGHTLLDPGCGEGEFIDGVLRWCHRRACQPPRIIGIELHPGRAAEARTRFANEPSVRVEETDFLTWDGPADYVIGNPPYVPITKLAEHEKTRYRERFATASGRFDLYALFFEQALRVLKDEGRLVFVTPEKYLSVGAAKPLRKLLARRTVREVVLLGEDTFPGLVTYPAVTVVDVAPSNEPTRVTLRDGTSRTLTFPSDGASVTPLIYDAATPAGSGFTLADVTDRISCGVATGADRVFVRPRDTLPSALLPFAFPTIAGRQLDPETEATPTEVMLVPYDRNGNLLPPDRLRDLGAYLATPERKRALLRRTCVRRKPWYAFHETPPMSDLLRPKLLCKDIASEPRFWIDRDGGIIPRHSVYYIVPRSADHLDTLADELNTDETAQWLKAHAQPAANGYRRLQSSVLKRIPLCDALIARLSGLEHSDASSRQTELSLTA